MQKLREREKWSDQNRGGEAVKTENGEEDNGWFTNKAIIVKKK